MRYLYRVDEDTPFAYAPTRRDFFRIADNTCWAHESHDWLVAATTGAPVAHRIGDRYYDAVSGEVLYRISSDPGAQQARPAAISPEHRDLPRASKHASRP